MTKNEKKYTALILDMDGTIMDSLAPMIKALRDTAQAWDFELTDEHISLTMYSSTAALLEALGLKEDGERFIQDFERRYGAESKANKLFAGMEEILFSPVRRGIVTNENRRELLHWLRKLGLDKELFEAFACAGDTPYEKPHPYPLEYCLEQMNVAACDALFIGDSINDMLCAKAAGVDFGLALWGAGRTEGFDSAKYIFDEPQMVLRHVANS